MTNSKRYSLMTSTVHHDQPVIKQSIKAVICSWKQNIGKHEKSSNTLNLRKCHFIFLKLICVLINKSCWKGCYEMGNLIYWRWKWKCIGKTRQYTPRTLEKLPFLKPIVLFLKVYAINNQRYRQMFKHKDDRLTYQWQNNWNIQQ